MRDPFSLTGSQSLRVRAALAVFLCTAFVVPAIFAAGAPAAPTVVDINIAKFAYGPKEITNVSDALVARRRYAEEIAADEQTVRTNTSLAEATELRYQNGVTSYLEVLDARRNLFSAQQALIQLKARLLQTSVTLYVALGGSRGTLHDRQVAASER